MARHRNEAGLANSIHLNPTDVDESRARIALRGVTSLISSIILRWSRSLSAHRLVTKNGAGFLKRSKNRLIGRHLGACFPRQARAYVA